MCSGYVRWWSYRTTMRYPKKGLCSNESTATMIMISVRQERYHRYICT
jgi:hypothetical protein